MEYEYEVEEEIDYKYIYCVLDDGMKIYYLNESDTRYIHSKGGDVKVIRCREGDLVYAKARMNSKGHFNW